jgi:hypothetical protein
MNPGSYSGDEDARWAKTLEAILGIHLHLPLSYETVILVLYGCALYRNKAVLTKYRLTTVRWRLQTAVFRCFTGVRFEYLFKSLWIYGKLCV